MYSCSKLNNPDVKKIYWFNFSGFFILLVCFSSGFSLRKPLAYSAFEPLSFACVYVPSVGIVEATLILCKTDNVFCP